MFLQFILYRISYAITTNTSLASFRRFMACLYTISSDLSFEQAMCFADLMYDGSHQRKRIFLTYANWPSCKNFLKTSFHLGFPAISCCFFKFLAQFKGDLCVFEGALCSDGYHIPLHADYDLRLGQAAKLPCGQPHT